MQPVSPQVVGDAPASANVDRADEPPPPPPDPLPIAAATPAAHAVGSHIFLSPEQVVARALFLSCVRKADLISVAGPDGLAAMLILCREGYERVECARQATCSGADEACDLLLIVGPMDAASLAQTVRRTARLLRDDGVLIAQLSGSVEEAVVRPALAAAGFEPRFSLIDRSAGRLVLHRVRRAEPARRTA